MYVYMRNYVKIKKMIYQKMKKNCKDNLRTLFVEIPSYKGAVDRAASLESALPNLTLIPANQLLRPHQTQLPSSPYLLPQRASLLPSKTERRPPSSVHL